MLMADYKEGKVEYKDGVTVIQPAIDEVDAPDLPLTGTFRERMQAAYDRAKLRAQMTGVKLPHTLEKVPHECNYWKLGASRMDFRIVLKRICASYQSPDGKVFKGCGKYMAFDVLPEAEARIRLAQIKHSDQEKRI